MQAEKRLLVIGADRASLGSAVVTTALLRGVATMRTVMAGPERDQDVLGNVHDLGIKRLNINDVSAICQIPWKDYDYVVMAAGANHPTPLDDYYGFDAVVEDLTMTNYTSVMRLMYLWMTCKDRRVGSSFVVVGSNSALIPRSGSAAYCASKAALNMGVRCLARDMRGQGIPGNLYGYDPCWLDGTAMSKAVEARLREEMGEGVQTHRVPGGRGMDPFDLAELIVDGLLNGHGPTLHGVMHRMDMGDQ